MNPILFDFPQETPLGLSLREQLPADQGSLLMRSFPDEETYLRVITPVKGRHVIVNATLFQPNAWILDLIFLADALKEQGALSVGLLAPYLAYMRQDAVFHSGEALTSKTFANLISAHFDYLITVDPHLHRYHHLSEIYAIPSTVIKAAPLLAKWVQKNVEKPFLIGPDLESEQWVHEVAGANPYVVLKKIRHSDHEVEIEWPKSLKIGDKTPLLVDDIISSGGTMVQALKHLENSDPICLAIHPLFSNNAYKSLLEHGAEQIVTTNSIPHPSNGIDLTPTVLAAVKAHI